MRIQETDVDHKTRDERVATGILRGLDPFTMQDAVARAKRTKLDCGGRQRRIGAHVGQMCRQLLFWEGKGELEDAWIHKTAREWEESEAALTKRMLKTAERVAMEEGLIEVEDGRRPGDQQQTKFYRLNLWALARVVVVSELENVTNRLEHEGRKTRRDQLNKRRRELKQAEADLDLVGKPNPPSDPFEGGVTSSNPGGNKLVPLQENTQENTSFSPRGGANSSAPHLQEQKEEEILTVKDAVTRYFGLLKERGFEYANAERYQIAGILKRAAETGDYCGFRRLDHLVEALVEMRNYDVGLAGGWYEGGLYEAQLVLEEIREAHELPF